jgi:DNA-binding MarR family transcriptional regulator
VTEDRYPMDSVAAHPVRDIADAWARERPGTPVSSIAVVTPLWRLAKLFGDDRRRVLAEAGVEPAVLDLLSALRRSGPPYALRTKDLADATMVTAGAISQRVARAERDGLVHRTPGTGRAVLVGLTDAGHRLVEATVDRVLRRESDLLTALSDDQREQLAALLDQLLADVLTRR